MQHSHPNSWTTFLQPPVPWNISLLTNLKSVSWSNPSPVSWFMIMQDVMVLFLYQTVFRPVLLPRSGFLVQFINCGDELSMFNASPNKFNSSWKTIYLSIKDTLSLVLFFSGKDLVLIERNTSWVLCIFYFDVLMCNKQFPTFPIMVFPPISASPNLAKSDCHFLYELIAHLFSPSHILCTCVVYVSVHCILSFDFFQSKATPPHSVGNFYPSNMVVGSNLIINLNTSALVWSIPSHTWSSQLT